MRAYVRKVKNKSGAASVQIEYKRGRERMGITHIGTAHNDGELKLLYALAQEKLHEGQVTIELFEGNNVEARLKRSYSGLCETR